jgi:hypothetical protein
MIHQLLPENAKHVIKDLHFKMEYAISYVQVPSFLVSSKMAPLFVSQK